MELAETVEQVNQYQTEYLLETKAKANKNKTRQLPITFHNPNTTEDTAKFLARLITDNLAEIRKAKNTVGPCTQVSGKEDME